MCEVDEVPWLARCPAQRVGNLGPVAVLQSLGNNGLPTCTKPAPESIGQARVRLILKAIGFRVNRMWPPLVALASSVIRSPT